MKTKKVTATTLPSESEIEKLVDLLGGVAGLVGDRGAVLTPSGRQSMVKALKGGKDFLPSFQRMAARHGLQVSGLMPADLQPHLDLIARLEPLLTSLKSATTLVGDTTLQAKSLTWKGTTALYTILSRMALDNPTLRAELKPATAFFAAAAKPGAGKSGKKKAGAKSSSVSSATEAQAAPEVAPSATDGAAAASAPAAVPPSVPTHR